MPTVHESLQFFLKGTQLSQLSEEYQTCMENISQTAKVLKRKAEVIPDLEEAYHEAQARFEEAERAREQRHKADELKKELAWAHVATKEAVGGLCIGRYVVADAYVLTGTDQQVDGSR